MHFIKVDKNILDNDKEISDNIRHNLHEHGIYMINIMSAPGAGKTSILEKILPELTKKFHVAVIEGDMQGSADADRILKTTGINAIQISTHSLCHLEPSMIEKVISKIDLHHTDIIIIENVGNLVCPAEFDLGEDDKIMIVSTTEGHDKPHKYPIMFRASDLVILNKIDLLEYTNFDTALFKQELEDLKYNPQIIETSATKNLGITEIVNYLTNKIMEKKNHVPSNSHENHKH